MQAAMPVAAVILGGVIAAFRPPGAKLRSAVQHFAAGLVFAAVAAELLPSIMNPSDVFSGAPVAVVIGFLIGIGLMLGIRKLTEGGEPKSVGAAKQPTSLLFTLGVDVVVDGLLIGIGSTTGGKQGFLLTVALTAEAMFLGLSGAVALSKAGASRAKIFGMSALLGGLLLIGSVLGITLLGGLSGFAKEAVLSFGAAALLFLVTEELLVEAHEEPETPTLTAMFFVGFVALLVVEMLA